MVINTGKGFSGPEDVDVRSDNVGRSTVAKFVDVDHLRTHLIFVTFYIRFGARVSGQIESNYIRIRNSTKI